MATYLNDSFQDYAGKFILKTIPFQTYEERNKATTYKVLFAELCEQMILYDTVFLLMDRTNAPLAILLAEIGPEMLGDAIEEGAIVPVLWTNQLMTWRDRDRVGRKVIKDGPPVLSGRLSSPENSQPEASIINAFDLLIEKQSPDDIKIFMKRVVDRYYIPENISADRSANAVISAYESNHLSSLGLPYKKLSSRLNDVERVQLMNLSGEVLSTTFAAKHDVFLLKTPSQFALAAASITSIGSAMQLNENFNEIRERETIPSLRYLYLDGIMDFNGFLNLRRSKEAKLFREWITKTERDKNSILKQYMDDNYKEKGYFEKNIPKFVKFGVVQTIGAGIGILAESAGIGTLAGASVAVALSAFDSYILDGVKDGWAPKRFIKEVEKTILRYKDR